jgi:chromosome segregation ATPase
MDSTTLKFIKDKCYKAREDCAIYYESWYNQSCPESRSNNAIVHLSVSMVEDLVDAYEKAVQPKTTNEAIVQALAKQLAETEASRERLVKHCAELAEQLDAEKRDAARKELENSTRFESLSNHHRETEEKLENTQLRCADLAEKLSNRKVKDAKYISALKGAVVKMWQKAMVYKRQRDNLTDILNRQQRDSWESSYSMDTCRAKYFKCLICLGPFCKYWG